jgi:DNA-directed RNA polymerase subunit E'/Rpb7
MIETKRISVLLNLNPKYLHKEIIKSHIEILLEKNVLNGCFLNLGKVIRINKILSIGLGKIHIDTGFSKTPVEFEADICLPKVDQVIKGIIERYDSNGGVYVNYKNIISIFCFNSNLNYLLNKLKNEKGEKKEKNEEIKKEIETDSEKFNENIGLEVTLKITKVNFNEQNMIIIGKII